jgi:hypothetical protein
MRELTDAEVVEPTIVMVHRLMGPVKQSAFSYAADPMRVAAGNTIDCFI